jgi:cytochrome oxidase Cu insertion factor (SCO1/SenC/PrrC family)
MKFCPSARPGWPVALLCAALLSAGGATAADIGGARLDQLPQHWRDEQGQALALTDLIGHRVILSMAYTRCHSICPATLGQMLRMQAALDARGEQASFVIVGYDPDNDEPASWRQYRLNRHLARSNWHFLTGTPRTIRQLARQLGFEFWAYDSHIMHDSRIVVFNNQGLVSGATGPGVADWSALL